MRISDWSSDVCSSDLVEAGLGARKEGIAGVLLLQLGNRDRLGGAAGFRQQDVGLAPADVLQHAAGATLQQQDAGQGDRQDAGEVGADRKSVVEGKSVAVR